MSKQEIIDQLKSLISDRESFITDEEDCEFKKDKEALEKAIKLIEKQEKMIDEMAEYLASIDFDEHCNEIPYICLNCPGEDDLEGNMNCIKHYFEKKASEENATIKN